MAADKEEKEALLRDGQAIVKAAEGLIAETKVCGYVGAVLIFGGECVYRLCMRGGSSIATATAC